MNQCHVSKVSLHYITCQVNFKPAVIIYEVVNALVATFLRGDERPVRSASRLSRAVLKLSRITERLDRTTFHTKINDLLWYCLRWNVKQPGEVCAGGKKYKA